MQSDARLIKNIERPHQRAAQGSNQIYTLAFSSREGVGGTVEGKIAQPHIIYIFKSGNNLFDRLVGNCMFVFRQVNVLQEIEKFPYIHAEHLMYCPATDFNVKSLLPQTASATGIADCLSRVTTEHVFILHLVPVRLNPAEKLIKADDRILFRLSRTAFPKFVPHLLAEIAVRLKDRDAIPNRVLDHLILEPAHLVSPPASNGTFVYGLALVRHHQILADSDYLSKTSADRTCSKRTVEAEHILIRTGEFHTVRFEAIDESPGLDITVRKLFSYEHRACTLVKGIVYRRMKARHQVFI